MNWRYLLILPAISFLVLAVYNGKSETGNKYDETKELIVLRKVVHQLLLSAGDSTSRILPVQQVSEYEYQLFPEKPLAISPDSFVNIVNNAVKEGRFSETFTASVVRKNDKEIVYGYVASPANDNGAPCLGRKLPKDNYYLSFVFPPSKKIHWGYWLAAALVLMPGLFFIITKRKKEPQVKPQLFAEEKAMPGGCLQIGNYIFNPGQQWLELNGQKETLTIKESKVLDILAGSLNTIIERDTLQKEVWENEGVIVTRSLDMFISKLRKKLSNDPSVKIVNVHGKGYKLSVDTI